MSQPESERRAAPLERSVSRKNSDGQVTEAFQGNVSRNHLFRPQLLVSVRSEAEAISALHGGAEILDVKEPDLGSLGMAPVGRIESISDMLTQTKQSVPFSVALGEVPDWSRTNQYPSLPGGITFAKLGLSGCRSLMDWDKIWKRVRLEFELRTESKLKWVAVAYADGQAADSPEIDDVLESAADSNCAGLLIDTWSKTSGGLLSHLSGSEITDVAEQCHSAGLFFAVAGRLSLEALPQLARAAIDVVAIRSAACRSGVRTAEIDRQQIHEFRDQMRHCFTHDGTKQ